MNKTLPALFTLALLSGCVVYKDAPIVDNGPPAVEGTPVALRQPVQAGPVVATPMTVVEDSRCPEIARCGWAGRLVVTTRIDGVTLALVSGLPEKQAQRETPASEYRFVYEAR